MRWTITLAGAREDGTTVVDVATIERPGCVTVGDVGAQLAEIAHLRRLVRRSEGSATVWGVHRAIHLRCDDLAAASAPGGSLKGSATMRS